MTTLVEFGEWLSRTMKKRGYTAAQLARRADVDPGIISRAVNGERMPSPENLTAIARGLGIPAEWIFQSAGYLPPTPADERDIQEIVHSLVDLPPEIRREVMDFIRFKTSQEPFKQSTREQTGPKQRPRFVRTKERENSSKS